METNRTKQLILRLLESSGFVKLWCYLRRNKVTIITYHGVMDTGVKADWEPLRSRISRHDFEEGLKLFRRYFNFVSMQTAVDILHGKDVSVKNPCVVTFDDGHLNNLTCALPILRKYQIPVIFYPATDFVDSGSPYWFDRLDYAIQQPGLDGKVLRIESAEITIDQSSRQAIQKTLSRLIRQLKRLKVTDQEFNHKVNDIINQLEGITGKSIENLESGDEWSSILTWQQINDCANSEDVEIGSHTVNHVRLSKADRNEIKYELSESKSRIEGNTGVPCNHFCFPNGDWSDEAVDQLRDLGYLSAVTSDPGENSQDSNIYLLKRHSVPNTKSSLNALFAITGIFHFKKSLMDKIKS